MAIIKPPSQKQLERRFKPYALELGKLVCSWNNLHNQLMLLFWAVTGIENGSVPMAIWHSTPSDLAQRRMLRGAVEHSFHSDKRAREDIIWLLDKIDKSLSQKRNDAVHVALTFMTGAEGTNLEPSPWSPRREALKAKDLLAEFIWYRETADALNEFCRRIHYFLLQQKHQAKQPLPWPDRPPLPHLVQRTNPTAKLRGKRDKAPQRPRGPSQA